MTPSEEQQIRDAHYELPEDCRRDPARPEDLVAFEREFGPIPAEYRWYLAECGGGVIGSGVIAGGEASGAASAASNGRSATSLVFADLVLAFLVATLGINQFLSVSTVRPGETHKVKRKGPTLLGRPTVELVQFGWLPVGARGILFNTARGISRSVLAHVGAPWRWRQDSLCRAIPRRSCRRRRPFPVLSSRVS